MYKMIFSAIKSLVEYAVSHNLITEDDRCFAVNKILEILNIEKFNDSDCILINNLEDILRQILNYAAEKGLIGESITERDLLDTKIMGALTPRPSEVIGKFWSKYEISPKDATDYYYKLSCDSDYIRKYRIKNDMKWVSKTEYGDLDITINLSKPEKDPMAVAAAKNAKQIGYPKCLLCKENEGYAGRLNHPARQNLRTIPIEINNTRWYFQYSPYVYYNEHCIAFNSQHIPMVINKDVFKKLLDFVKLFPHYFIGSNADLPIVGGSILSHEHFQGGCYTFAMEKAPIEKAIFFKGFEDIDAGIVKWPMSVIRISGESADRLVELADKILESWRRYTDKEVFIFSETNGVLHNTITPIARMRKGKFELDLVLRNNITTEENPLGVYHPHAELHHIKRENIGLIEVMGLAVLPSRLKDELRILGKKIVNGEDLFSDTVTNKHAAWATEFMKKYGNITADNVDGIIQNEVGIVFLKVLEHAGVFKRDENGSKAFLRFVSQV